METVFDIQEIRKTLLHRYPFLLIDKVVEFEDTKRLVAIKNVTINEEFFQGHFPDKPVMPGVLVLEAMAQAAAIMAIKSTGGIKPGNAVFLVGADKFKWRRQVLPGDTLKIEVVFTRRKGPFWYITGTVTVDGNVCATGELAAAEGPAV